MADLAYMNDYKAKRSSGTCARTARRRRKRRLTPAQKLARWVRKNLAAILVTGLVSAGVILGSVCTANVMAWKARHTVHDYGRTLLYASYTVQPGDTMWDIAVDMAALNPEFTDVRQYLSLLQSTNHIYGDYLQSGTVIQVPYYDAGDAAPMLDIYLKYGIANTEKWLEKLD